MSDNEIHMYALRCIKLRDDIIKIFEDGFHSPREIIAVLTSLIASICLNEKNHDLCLQQTIECIKTSMKDMEEAMKNDI